MFGGTEISLNKILHSAVITIYFLAFPSSMFVGLLFIFKFAASVKIEHWKQFSEIHGLSLNTSFNSSFGLVGEYKLNPWTQNAFNCYSYMHGEQFAAIVRSKNLTRQFKPISVNFSQQRMCFVAINNLDPMLNNTLRESANLPDFSLPLLPSLKIHDSILAATRIHAMLPLWGNSVPPPDMTVLFLNETFSTLNATFEHFNASISELSSYSIKPFESFFWTSTFAKSHFDFAPSVVASSAEFQSDKRRMAAWIEVISYFTKDVAPQSTNDPCGFQRYSMDKNSIQAAKLVLSIEHLHAMQDKMLSNTCLAYLAIVFALDDAVNHIALTFRPQLLNFRARSIQQSATVGNDPGSSPYTDAGLRGDDQVVAIADSGLDLNSCYFYDPEGSVPFSQISSPEYDTYYRKVIQYTYWFPSDTSDESGGHGTHVCGTAVGNKDGADIFNDGQYDGVAPNAKIAFMDLAVPGSGLYVPPQVHDLYAPGYHAGARVHSNSWGSTFSGSQYYCSHDVDDLIHNNNELAVFFAAGNFGMNGDSTVTMDSSGKNVITIGSSQTTLNSNDINNVAWYSSRGPVYDHRWKPDLVAPGDQLMSARSNGDGGQSCDTHTMTGTSMASPAAAGAALLVRQYFTDGSDRFWNGVCNRRYDSCRSFAPSGVLVKAVLIHSGTGMAMYDGDGDNDVPLGNPPDFYQGFGRITLQNVLPLPGRAIIDLFVDDQFCLNENTQVSYRVNIQPQDTFVPLKATLSWYDPPNVDGVTTAALLHDLDLTLTAPNGDIYHGNGYDRDWNNNNERVVIDNPQDGSWVVTVSANALPVTGGQCFSLVITSRGEVDYW